MKTNRGCHSEAFQVNQTSSPRESSQTTSQKPLNAVSQSSRLFRDFSGSVLPLPRGGESMHQQIQMRRKETILYKIEERRHKEAERNRFNLQTNKLLAVIRGQNKSRREQMESIVSRYKQQYDRAYQQQLQSRKALLKPIDFQDIKQHQHNFMKQVSKRPRRVRTESSVPLQKIQGFAHGHNEQEAIQKQQAVKALQRRRLYTDHLDRVLMSQKLGKVKAKSSTVQKKRRKNTKTSPESIKDISSLRKARLDTNLRKSNLNCKEYEINRISEEKRPALERMSKLRNLADSYLLQHSLGRQDALGLISQVNMARADLILRES